MCRSTGSSSLAAGAPSSARQKAGAGLQLCGESVESSFLHWSKSHWVHMINSEDGLRKPQITCLLLHIRLTVSRQQRVFPRTYVYDNHSRLLLYAHIILINFRNKGQPIFEAQFFYSNWKLQKLVSERFSFVNKQGLMAKN